MLLKEYMLCYSFGKSPIRIKAKFRVANVEIAVLIIKNQNNAHIAYYLEWYIEVVKINYVIDCWH